MLSVFTAVALGFWFSYFMSFKRTESVCLLSGSPRTIDAWMRRSLEPALCRPPEWESLFFHRQLRRAFVFNSNYFVSLKHSDGCTEMKPYWAWQEVNANTLSKDLVFMATQDWTAKVTHELNYVIYFLIINSNVFVHHLGHHLSWTGLHLCFCLLWEWNEVKYKLLIGSKWCRQGDILTKNIRWKLKMECEVNIDV